MTDKDLRRMRRMYRNGLTAKEIAERLGYSVSNINYVIQNNRDKFPYRNRHTSDEVRRECASLVLDDDMPMKAVARKLGVNINTVRKYVSKELRSRMAANAKA